jgi:hypothetical protein
MEQFLLMMVVEEEAWSTGDDTRKLSTHHRSPA